MQQVPGKPEKSKSLDKWRCSKCSFDNLQLMPNCEICEEPRQRSPKKLELSKQTTQRKQPGINCPKSSCNYFNPLTVDCCEKCGKNLFSDEQQDDKQKKQSGQKKLMTNCNSCGFQNDPQNEYCVNCDKKFKKKILKKSEKRPRKPARWRAGMVPCPGCGTNLRVINYETNQTVDCDECDNTIEITKTLCTFCDKKLNKDQQKSHDSECSARSQFFDHRKNPTFDRCTPLQYETMFYMHKKCQKLHFKREKKLVERVKKLGYSESDLQNLHHYIIHYAPIIIHMHVNTHFHFFLSDTHYRNQFETSKSSGSLSTSSRTSWEDRMFDHKHHHASGFERVKYGTMNFTNDPKGVRACAGYGQSYFLLKNHVRDRCTITDMDSSSSSATLGTFRFIFHLLMKLSDAELHSAFEGSKGKQMKSHCIGSYKEIQIHGPVQFAKDIERLYISKDQLKLGNAKQLMEQVKTFCSKHSLDYQLFENQKVHPPIGGFMGGIGIDPLGRGTLVSEERIVGDKKELTEEELKPPAPVAVGGIYGGGIGLFAGGGGLFGSSYISAPSFPAPSYGVSHFSFGSPVPFSVPKKPQKRKEYGVDYI